MVTMVTILVLHGNHGNLGAPWSAIGLIKGSKSLVKALKDIFDLFTVPRMAIVLSVI